LQAGVPLVEPELEVVLPEVVLPEVAPLVAPELELAPLVEPLLEVAPLVAPLLVVAPLVEPLLVETPEVAPLVELELELEVAPLVELALEVAPDVAPEVDPWLPLLELEVVELENTPVVPVPPEVELQAAKPATTKKKETRMYPPNPAEPNPRGGVTNPLPAPAQATPPSLFRHSLLDSAPRMTGEALTLPRKRRPSLGSAPSTPGGMPDFSVTVDLSSLMSGSTLGAGDLRTLPLFRDATRDAMDALADATQPRSLAAGEVLFNEGQPARSVYVVRSGAIEIHRARGTLTGSALAEVGPGDWLGLFGLLAGRRRAALARAKGPSELIEIDASALVRLLTAETPVREAAKRHFHGRLAQLLCGSHPLFSHVTSLERARLAASFHTLDLKAGRHSVLMESEQTALHIVAHGKLRLAVPELSEATPLARGHLFGVSAGSVALEPLTRLHLLRLSPGDCESPFFAGLADRARALGLSLDRHLFVGDAGIAGLS
jgi:CRP-like cAMP-binding protein